MPLHVKANALMKANIDAILKRRGLSRRGLARYCLRTQDPKADTWMSHIMKDTDREFPMKYWDRITDYLGVDYYVLFQPGLGEGIERRSGQDRRLGHERRLNQMMVPEKPDVGQLIKLIHVLPVERREVVAQVARDQMADWIAALRPPRAPAATSAALDRTAENTPPVPAPAKTGRGRRQMR